MDFVCKLYGNTYAVHVTVALVGVATLNLALPAPLKKVHVERRHFDQQLFDFSTAFYIILKITKLALKYHLFHPICFSYSRDMFD